MSHYHYLLHCLTLAQEAQTRGNNPVGAVVKLNGEVVGEGLEMASSKQDITYHAEIEAIRAATSHLQDANLSACRLYTTHEPCIMCSYVIRHHSIRGVVVIKPTPDVGGFSSAHSVLVSDAISKWGHPPEVTFARDLVQIVDYQEVIGTFALIKTAQLNFELSKMTVDHRFRGAGIGKRLMEACLGKAQKTGIQKLERYTQKVLLEAIQLYRQYGFCEIPLNQHKYSRAER